MSVAHGDLRLVEPAPSPGRARYIPSLDGIRAAAVLLVLVAHLPRAPFERIHPAVPQVMSIAGYLGVDLFFVLSGFLITRILLADRETGSPLSAFYVRRALRIFPIYYLVLAVHLLISPTPALGWCAVYLSNYYFAVVPERGLLGHTWSLAVEEHFYLGWPLLVRHCNPERAKRFLPLILLTSVTSSAVLILLDAPHVQNLIYNGTLSRMWSLSLGGALAYMKAGEKEAPSTALQGGSALAGLVFVGIGLVLGKNGSPWALVANVLGFSLISVSVVTVALAAQHARTRVVENVLSARPLRFVGRISYGLYLYHPFAYAAVFGARHTYAQASSSSGALFPVQALVAIAGTFALATTSFYFIESHFLRLKDRLHSSRAPASS